jgi:protein SCO1/2
MSKNKLFIAIAGISLFTIFASLISMMILTPSAKEKNTSLYNRERQEIENLQAKISSDFTLKTASNQEFNSKTLRGKFVLIYFGSTYCPSISLPDLLKLKTIIDSLGKSHTKGLIDFIFITADPMQDTKERLNSYFKELDPRIIPLTGDKDQIELVLKNYKVRNFLFAEKPEPQTEETAPSQCILTAPAPFYLIGKDGELIKTYKTYSTGLSMSKDILHYIKVS